MGRQGKQARLNRQGRRALKSSGSNDDRSSNRKKRRTSLSASSHADDDSRNDDDDDSKIDDDDSRIDDRDPKRRKLDRAPDSSPSIYFSKSNRLQDFVKLIDLQSLVLYLLADGTAPSWVAVRHRQKIDQVVVLMVPGLERGMFTGDIPLDDSRLERHEGKIPTTQRDSSTYEESKRANPDDYYPRPLEKERMPGVLKPLADIFPHAWPILAPGEWKYPKVHSPLFGFFNVPRPKMPAEQPATQKSHRNSVGGRTPVSKFVASLNELCENEFVIHPALCGSDETRAALLLKREQDKTSIADGWVDTAVTALDELTKDDDRAEAGSVTLGNQVLAVDCEMCLTSSAEFELTRVSVINWHGETLLDELVKPENPIKDYLTAYSGMTKDLLDPVTTRLHDVQQKLLELITPTTILVGHSLNSDLNALKMTHPFLIDTSIIFPHPQGAPLKHGLKWLSQRFLKREIQKSHGSTGHDSVEDARATLDLVKMKTENGPAWGVMGAITEPIFKRIGRETKRNDDGERRPGRSAMVDWSNARHGFALSADIAIRCENDDEVVEGVLRTIKAQPDTGDCGVDLVWARLRELERARGWDVPAADNEAPNKEAASERATSIENDGGRGKLPAAVGGAVRRIEAIHAALAPGAALVVYSGTADTREFFRLQRLQHRFKQEYRVKKWDELSVRWTDAEEQAMRRACREAREGVGFVGVRGEATATAV
jgi:RNA exonuclease 1